jgi:orotidine-5'-phosphate decarboxylase
LLIPGVGAQGGDADAAVRAGWRDADGAGDGGGPILVNASRSILYAGAGEGFAQAARDAARATREQLARALHGIASS